MQGPLGPEWEECFDAASGRPYYKNHTHQYTTWERPAPPPPPQAQGNAYPPSWDAPRAYPGLAPAPANVYGVPPSTIAPSLGYPQQQAASPYATPPQAYGQQVFMVNAPPLVVQPAQPTQFTGGVVMMGTGLTLRKQQAVKVAPVVMTDVYVIPATGRQTVHIRCDKGRYLTADFANGGLLMADRKVAKGWETFIIEHLGGGRFSIMCDGRYLSADGGGGGQLHCNRDKVAEWEHFEIMAMPHSGGTRVAIRSHRGKYLCAEGGGGTLVTATRQSIAKWEIFQLIPH